MKILIGNIDEKVIKMFGIDMKDKSEIKWAKDSVISRYYLIYANRITNIVISKGNLFMSRTTRNGITRFTDSGTNPKKWYLTDDGYTFYNRPFDTLADAKAYAVKEYLKGNLDGASDLKKYNPNMFPFRKE